jgi:pimeloyl-ACP methyl ester carboxylesterase
MDPAYTGRAVRSPAMSDLPSRRRLIRPAAVILAVLAGLLVGFGVDVVRSGGIGPWLARHGLPPPYIAQGERIDIGARSLYLDCRGSGSPTIVLEAGSGSDSGTWSAVHDAIAGTTRTCAYDRAGRGRSDDREEHTLADAVTDLRALLDAAGERPPFIVVGHSLGGSYARVFATTYPGEVVGAVLVDSFEPDIQDDRIHPLLGELRPEYEAGLDGLRAHVARVDGLDWPASEQQLRAASFDGVPLEVLVAARREPRLDDATNESIANAWRDGMEALSPGQTRYTIVYGAGHNIHIERPDTVIDATRRLIEAARSR